MAGDKMVKTTERIGLTTILIGAIDWFTRYDLVKGLVTKVAGAGFSAYVAQWWLSPLILVIGFGLPYLPRIIEFLISVGSPPHYEPATWDKPPSVKASVEDSGNSNATGGSATATIGDIHIHPPMVATSSSSTQLPALPKFTPRRERVVYIEHSEPIVRAVHLDNENVWRIGATRNYGDENAVGILLPLYFDAKQSDAGARMEYTRVHLIFKTSSLPPVRVDHACWVNASYDTMELDVGETKHIVLALLVTGKESESVAPITISTNRTKSDWYRESGGEVLEYIELQTNVYNLEAVVIWGGNGEFRKIIELSLDLSDIPKLLSQGS